MKFNISLIAVACVLASTTVLAEESEPTAQLAEDYSYSDHLDIAKVISVTEPARVCGATPVVMVYEDSKGARHTMRYQVVGSGCDNG